MKEILALFEDDGIRKVYKNNKWYYSIDDVICKLTSTNNPSKYIQDVKEKDKEIKNKWDILCTQLNMRTENNKIRKIRTSDTIGILRIIESIKEANVEPYKIWLAKIGNDRIGEISNPEILMNRMIQIYEEKGYSQKWIEQRIIEIMSKYNLSNTKNLSQNKEYNILISEIFESKTSAKIKDKMTSIELALTNLENIIQIELYENNKINELSIIKNNIFKFKREIINILTNH